MKLNLYPILKEMSQAELARMLVADGIYKSFESARNAIQNQLHERVKSVDLALLEYLEGKFKMKRNQLLID